MAEPASKGTQEGTDALQDVTVMNDEELKYGLPSHYFFGGVAMTVAFGFVMKKVWWLISPTFALIYFTAMYAIHKDDPRGAQGWVRAMRRGSFWSAGQTKSRRVHFLQSRE